MYKRALIHLWPSKQVPVPLRHAKVNRLVARVDKPVDILWMIGATVAEGTKCSRERKQNIA
jgi:hypothetical protein